MKIDISVLSFVSIVYGWFQKMFGTYAVDWKYFSSSASFYVERCEAFENKKKEIIIFGVGFILYSSRFCICPNDKLF